MTNLPVHPLDQTPMRECRYTEQIIVDKSITLAPMPGETVIVRWVTNRPYESALIIQTPEKVSIRGITIQHSSPSIANNYAVYLGPQCSSLTEVEGCTIVSHTGSGVGIEGGTPMLLQCTIRGCAKNGVCIYGNSAVEETDAISFSRGNERPTVKNCIIEGNGKHGLLIADGVTPSLDSNMVENNAGYGLVLQNCGGDYKNNVFEKNKKGSVAYWLADLGNSNNVAELLTSSNTLLGGGVVETRVTN